jgi:hypothetical protein
MKLWVIIIVAYAPTSLGCVTDKGRKLGGTSNETCYSPEPTGLIRGPFPKVHENFPF